MAEREPISNGRLRAGGDPVDTAGPITGRMVLAGLLAFFGLVASVNAAMIYAAVSTFGGVETESSYRAGLAFAREAATVEAQDALHWNVTAQAAIEGGTTVIAVMARNSAGRPMRDLAATASLVHPTDRRADHAVLLVSDGAGRFRGTTTASAGQWDLVIELSRDDERLFRSKNRVWLR